MVNHFLGAVTDVVHPAYPLHLIAGIELLCHAFSFLHLVYKAVKHLVCLFVKIDKIVTELALNPKLTEQGLVTLSDIPQMTLTENALGSWSGSSSNAGTSTSVSSSQSPIFW